MTTEQAFSLLLDVIRSLNPELDSVSPDSTLLGTQGILDSVGFINLLVTVEEKLEGKIDLASLFIEESDNAESGPFSTVDALAIYISNNV